ncbi:MAG: ATP synthase subunit I [Dolichospermum sp.]
MSLSDESITPAQTAQQDQKSGFEDTKSANSSMEEFYQLYRELILITLVLTGIVFISVWIAYSPNIALNYLLGACAGVLYLKMLAKDVESLGREKQKLSKTRLALLVVLILLASKLNQLHILPIFLGFLTYKATLIIYVVRLALISDSSKLRQP